MAILPYWDQILTGKRTLNTTHTKNAPEIFPRKICPTFLSAARQAYVYVQPVVMLNSGVSLFVCFLVSRNRTHKENRATKMYQKHPKRWKKWNKTQNG